MAAELAPCPFCGQALSVMRRPHNPYARCATDGCKAQQLPLLNLDDPEDIRAWNTRAPAIPLPEGDGTGVTAARTPG